MGIKSLCRRFPKDVFFPEEHKGARGVIARYGIHKNKGVQADDLMSEVERRSADVGDHNIVTEVVQRFQHSNNIRTDAIVSEENVSDAGDECAFHRIFATPILRPEGSNA
jgi:hypothetical protein